MIRPPVSPRVPGELSLLYLGQINATSSRGLSSDLGCPVSMRRDTNQNRAAGRGTMRVHNVRCEYHFDIAGAVHHMAGTVVSLLH